MVLFYIILEISIILETYIRKLPALFSGEGD